jgi:hypothetical protein
MCTCLNLAMLHGDTFVVFPIATRLCTYTEQEVQCIVTRAPLCAFLFDTCTPAYIYIYIYIYIYVHISLHVRRMAAREHDREYVPLELSDDEEWIARLFEPIREQVWWYTCMCMCMNVSTLV